MSIDLPENPKTTPESQGRNLSRSRPEDLPSLPAALEEEIIESLGDLVPVDDREEVVSRIGAMVVRHEAFSGPIAHPSHLREYEAIVPGSAERIISMAEQQLNHHINQEKIALKAETGDGRIGLWIGGAIFALLVACAFCAMMLDKGTLYAGIFLGTAAVGGIAVFVRKKDE